MVALYQIAATLFLSTVRPRKNNPKTKVCCDEVMGCMTVVVLLSESMIIVLSNDTLLKFFQSCITEQHCFQN